MGFIFTNADLNKTRDVILAEKVAAPARAGAVAPLDVFVPAGNTGMEPGKTSFFQALGVPTKIARGTIEITTDLKLIEAGSKVGASEATLLNMLNISPFTYGMSIAQIYDGGQTFAPEVLDIKEEQLLKAFNSAIATITQISLAANFPTLPSIMHSLLNSYKKVLAVAIETDYSWEGIDELKDRIANPDAYAAAAPEATTEAEAEKPAETKDEKPDEPEESSGDEGMALRLKLRLHLLIFLQDSGVSLTRSCSKAYIAAKTNQDMMMPRQHAQLDVLQLVYVRALRKPRSLRPSTTRYYKGVHGSVRCKPPPPSLFIHTIHTLWRRINYFLTPMISMTRQTKTTTTTL